MASKSATQIKINNSEYERTKNGYIDLVMSLNFDEQMPPFMQKIMSVNKLNPLTRIV